jgi:hypothetical protein
MLYVTETYRDPKTKENWHRILFKTEDFDKANRFFIGIRTQTRMTIDSDLTLDSISVNNKEIIDREPER